jgi:DNA polymerase-3 subunit alpha
LDVGARACPHAKAAGHEALGLTNHGNIFGLVDHHRQCEEVGIKPIHGIEMYLTESEEKPEDRVFYHQTILVMDAVGYRNLMRLVTKSYELFYYKPRVTLELLEAHADGLIVLSGCPSSMIHRMLQAGNEDRAREVFSRLHAAFGDRFYAEVQHHESTRATTRWLVEEAERRGVRLVATNDAHYVSADDKVVHDFVLGAKKKGKGEDNPTYGEGFHIIETAREAAGYLLSAHPWMSKAQVASAVSETARIADRVDFKFEKPSSMIPPMWGKDSRDLLRRKAVEGLASRGLAKKRDYVERLRRELHVVELLGYVDYFHVVREATTWAREHGILIGPRGSVCGSLLAYCLGVTTVDPIYHGTLFERFLHEQKTSPPDVDLDIDSENRDRLHGWLLERFKPYAYPIIAFGRGGPGMIVKDLADALPDVQPDLWNELKQELNEMRFVHHVEVPSEEELRDLAPSIEDIEKDVPWIVRCVSRLVGAVRYVGKHPGGICFVPEEDYSKWIALVRKPNEDHALTSYSYLDVAHIGLLKFDFLGLNAMTTLNRTIKLIGERHDEDVVSLDSIPLNDEGVFRRFAAGDTDGIFQFETRGARNILKAIEPDSFAELVASTALNRPGVSANLEKYVEGKRAGREHEQFPETYGALVYQEQISLSLRKLGLDWKDADVFLKSIKSHTIGYNVALKAQTGIDIHEKIKALLRETKGYTEAQAQEYIDTINQYSFNMGHAVGYTLTAYLQMWLRVHYPLEFWTSTLNTETVEVKRWAYERAAIFDGVVLLPPHVNGSAHYRIEQNAIRVGLKTVKGVGEKTAENVVALGPYEKARDILKVPKKVANAGAVKAMILAGALIMDPEKWLEHAVNYNAARKEAKLGGWQYKGQAFGKIA